MAETPDFRLDGKTAFVTGAGSGLGRAFTVALAARGATVVASDVNEQDLNDTAGKVGEAVRPAVLDVTDLEAVEEAISEAAAAHQGLDVLINNAGIAVKGTRTHDLEKADWDRVVDINLTGAFNCCRAALPHMMSSGGGAIINIASIAGVGGHYPDFPMVSPAYVASKAGLIGLTKQLALEYAKDNIRANAVAPGWHGGTQLAREFKPHMSNADVDRFEGNISETTPMGRRGTPEELAGLIVYLASDASVYLTGQVIAHDGGWTAQ